MWVHALDCEQKWPKFSQNQSNSFEKTRRFHQLVSDMHMNCTNGRIMMTSSNGNIFRGTGHLCGKFTGPRWIPHTKASDAELWCLLWCAPDNRFSKQSWSWWFETLSCPLWRHRNDQADGMVVKWNDHYDNAIMGAMASQITSLRIVYSTVYSGADQSKHQSSASLAFVWGIPAQMASNAENVSIWWRHHEYWKLKLEWTSTSEPEDWTNFFRLSSHYSRNLCKGRLIAYVDEYP